VTIAIPYTLKTGENPAGVVVWYLDANGNIEKMATVYDAKTKTVIFTTTHLSLYAIGYEEPAQGAWINPFTDVKEGDWYYGDVEYAAVNGLFEGTSATTFSPNTPMTRGMLVTVLYRLHGSAAGSSGNPFSDVPGGQYYTDAVLWAAANGIVEGYDGKFSPNAPITRQDMAVILLRYAEYAGKQFPVTLQYVTFADDASIADYAANAVKTLYCGGIISGKPGNIFDPKGNATRAEVAAVLHRFAIVASGGELPLTDNPKTGADGGSNAPLAAAVGTAGASAAILSARKRNDGEPDEE
jgi:hypothetical protein